MFRFARRSLMTSVLRQQPMMLRMSGMPIFQYRSIHQRGYNNFNDVYEFDFHEINLQLGNAVGIENIMFIYKKFEGKMTPEQIMFGFRKIGVHGLERNEDFWKILVPLVKKQISTLDRETIRPLMTAIEGAQAMYLSDNEFWELVEQKLVDEGLHRYYNLDELAHLVLYLSKVGRGSDDMIEIVEKTMIKHRKGLTPETIAIAKEGFSRINKGSEILQRVLEDPNTQLPALE